jgi:hypothetical protein
MPHATTISQVLLDVLLAGDDRCPIKIGQRVMKVNSEKGDLNPNGTKGIVIGNLYTDVPGIGYYVRFDDKPFPIFCVEKKVQLIEEE